MCSKIEKEKEVGEKERIQVLLAEYNSLRGEINSRVSNAFQVAGFGVAAVALLLAQSFSYAALFGASGLILILNWIIFRDFYKAAIRVRELEEDINKRVDQPLLVWESERGGLTIPNWQLRVLLRLLWLSNK